MAITDIIADIAVYVPDGRYIVSGMSGVCYLDDKVLPNPFDMGWIGEIDSKSKSSVQWILSRSVPKGICPGEVVLSLIARMPKTANSHMPVYVCISVRQDRLASYALTEADVSLYLTDEKNGSMSADSISINGTSGLSDSVRYTSDSAVTPWYYVMEVPKAVFSHFTDQLTKRMVIVSCIAVPLMIAIGMLMIRQLTYPFANMLEQARKLRMQELKAHHRDDLHFVEETFCKLIDDNTFAQTQFRQKRDVLKRSFLLTLISGRHMSLEDIDGYMDFLGIDMPLKYCAAFLIIDKDKPIQTQDEEYIENVITGHFAGDIHFATAGAYGGQMYWIVNFDDENRVSGLMDSIYSILQSAVLRYDVQIVLGSVVEGMDSIEESFHIALAAALNNERVSAEETNSEKNENEDAAETEQANKAAQYIEINYSKDISVQEIADYLGISRSHLSRMFKQFYGITILEYLLNVRMDKAMRLLKETQMSVSDISASVGFNTSNYFFRRFREKYGCTPMQFRDESGHDTVQ